MIWLTDGKIVKTTTTTPAVLYPLPLILLLLLSRLQQKFCCKLQILNLAPKYPIFKSGFKKFIGRWKMCMASLCDKKKSDKKYGLLYGVGKQNTSCELGAIQKRFQKIHRQMEDVYGVTLWQKKVWQEVRLTLWSGKAKHELRAWGHSKRTSPQKWQFLDHPTPMSPLVTISGYPPLPMHQVNSDKLSLRIQVTKTIWGHFKNGN